MAHDRRQPAVVLAVADDPGALELLARLLDREGHRPEPAHDVAAAVERAATTLPRCVVVDLRHAGLGSALQLVGLLRSHDDPRVAAVRIVVVDEAGNGRTVLAAGADAHLSRPAHLGDVAAVVGLLSTS